jgi:hypothetical protein
MVTQGPNIGRVLNTMENETLIPTVVRSGAEASEVLPSRQR